MIGAIIFDFDGVIADSETLANIVLAEAVSSLGLPTTLDEAIDRYLGKRLFEVVAAIEADLGSPLPQDFSSTLKTGTLARFRSDLREVAGSRDFIRRFGGLPRCIASSSSADRLAVCLEVLGITAEFESRIFSADLVPRGKPHPDIFLYAAKQLGIEPASCIVIEDSASGVMAGVAAGMTVIGLCAASHLGEGHAGRLSEAGATRVAHTWQEISDYVSLNLKA